MNPTSELERLSAALLPWQQRVVDEKQELDERLTKLGAFLDDPVKTLGLHPVDQALLMQQRTQMHALSETLRLRVARFKL